MDIHRYGERALLVDLPTELAEPTQPTQSVDLTGTTTARHATGTVVTNPATLAAAARVRFGPNLVEAVPAEQTLLLVFRTPSEAVAAIEELAHLDAAESPPPESDVIAIPVSYTGPDLTSAAAALAISPAELIATHTGITFRVAFFGFAPGFAYLAGLPPTLHLPRRATPRTRVPAGAVAIAAHYSAIYPQESPGGWHLIGRTDVVLFDPNKAHPSLLEPGSHVRFHAI